MVINKNGLPSKDTLDKLSYKTSLNRSLKQISLSKVDIRNVVMDLMGYRKKLMGSHEFSSIKHKRIKSIQSIELKYSKYMRGNGCKASQCFNDILGIRVYIQKYPSNIPEYFRVVNMKNGKANDDGYRAMHLYYQKDGYHYPIEIQIWCGRDIQYNIWSHSNVYKYVNPEIGRELRYLYDNGRIRNQEEFNRTLEILMKRRIE